jgi:hypothetical protein
LVLPSSLATFASLKKIEKKSTNRMALKIGDKVRFLNSTGGGVIRRFVSKELVAVEEEDGFETPVLIKECVVVESVSSKNEIQSFTTKRKVTEYKPIETKRVETPAPKIVETRDGDSMNVVLAFLPMDEKSLQNTNFETYLVNDSNYFIQFNYLSKQGKNWILRHSDTVEPNQQVFIEEFSKEQLNDLERICIQLVSYKQGKPFELNNPVSVELRLDTVKFYKLHCFQDNEYFDDKAILCPIVRKDVPERSFVINPEEIEHSMRMKGDYKTAVKQDVKGLADKSILEVDLRWICISMSCAIIFQV